MQFKKKHFMAPFYGRGSTASRLQATTTRQLTFDHQVPTVGKPMKRKILKIHKVF